MKNIDKKEFINNFKSKSSPTPKINKKKFINFSLSEKADTKAVKNILYYISILFFSLLSLCGVCALVALGSFTNLYSDDSIHKIKELTSSVSKLGVEKSSYSNLLFIQNIYDNKNLILIGGIIFIILTLLFAVILNFLRRKNVK